MDTSQTCADQTVLEVVKTSQMASLNRAIGSKYTPHTLTHTMPTTTTHNNVEQKSLISETLCWFKNKFMLKK